MSPSATWSRSRWRWETSCDRARSQRSAIIGPRTATPSLHPGAARCLLGCRFCSAVVHRPLPEPRTRATLRSDAVATPATTIHGATRRLAGTASLDQALHPWTLPWSVPWECRLCPRRGTCGARRCSVRTTRLAGMARQPVPAHVRRLRSRAEEHRRRAAGATTGSSEACGQEVCQPHATGAC